MMPKNDGGPAFPGEYFDEESSSCLTPGMSLRDWFAGMALQGMLASGRNVRATHRSTRTEALAIMCYQAADAMLKAREANDA
jgi:hypothetical protein